VSSSQNKTRGWIHTDETLQLVYQTQVLPEVVNNVINSLRTNPPKGYRIIETNVDFFIYKDSLEIQIHKTPSVGVAIDHQIVGMCRIRSRRPSQPDIFGYAVVFEHFGKYIRINPNMKLD
jgi:hypothetical protein